MNDCRENINKAKLTKQDKLRLNVSVMLININNWPVLFVITNKDIKKGDELFLYYGPDYHFNLQEKQLQDDIVQQNIHFIDSQLASL